MTVLGFIILIVVVALLVYLARLLIPDPMAQRVVIILICVVAILYVLQGIGGLGDLRLTR